jgi:hypothetical protein
VTIQLIKDVVLIQLDAVELRQVLDERSMIHAVWSQFQADAAAADRSQRWLPQAAPLKICHEERGRGHVLHCRLSLWRYFRDVEAINPLEREIRAHLLTLGVSGEADRRIGRYSPADTAAASAPL